MLDDIQSGKVHTDYVLVFKLSRFGRNARDVLNSLEFIRGAWHGESDGQRKFPAKITNIDL